MECKFSIERRKGMTTWLDCSVDGGSCAFQRYCDLKKKVINTEKFASCLNYKKGENKESENKQ